ncbi:MAG: PqqD family protein [Candidatus Fermentibacteraceae bacterium]
MKLSFATGVVFRREPEGGILFNVNSGALQIVEEVAVAICSMIDERASREDILTRLRQSYPDRPEVERDLDDFLAQLRQNGVIE